MLYHHVRAPRSGVDIEQMVLRLREDIDPEAFRRAWQSLLDRHPGFQTSFEWDGAAQPRQFEHAGTAIEWLEHDLRGSAGTEQQQKIADFLRADRERGFDLSVPPLCRGTLFRLDDAEWEFVWTFHHICADGHAYPGLIREALDFYERGVAEPVHGLPLPVTYRDYVRWLDADLALNRDHAKSYWQETSEVLPARPRFRMHWKPALRRRVTTRFRYTCRVMLRQNWKRFPTIAPSPSIPSSWRRGRDCWPCTATRRMSSSARREPAVEIRCRERKISSAY